MFKFDPKIDEEKTNTATSFENIILPEGDYDFVVKRATQKVSKSGNDMLEVILTVENDNKKADVFDWLLEAMKHKLKHFCQTTGFADEYAKGELDESYLVGAKGKVSLVIEDSEQYGTKNKVKDYIVSGTRIELIKGRESDFLDDDIPF